MNLLKGDRVGDKSCGLKLNFKAILLVLQVLSFALQGIPAAKIISLNRPVWQLLNHVQAYVKEILQLIPMGKIFCIHLSILHTSSRLSPLAS